MVEGINDFMMDKEFVRHFYVMYYAPITIKGLSNVEKNDGTGCSDALP